MNDSVDPEILVRAMQALIREQDEIIEEVSAAEDQLFRLVSFFSSIAKKSPEFLNLLKHDKGVDDLDMRGQEFVRDILWEAFGEQASKKD